MRELLLAFLSSAVGTLGFAMLLHAPKRSWLPGSLVAGAAFLVYDLLVRTGLSEASSILFGSIFGSILAQILARKMKMISTVFVTLSIVSFVPGLGLYRCMMYLESDQASLGVKAGVDAMICIAMITLGLGVGGFLYRMFHALVEGWKRKAQGT
ncbi:MAG: threonine/serine exporter family protein [Clostridia bacterium]|nr:threonine/serine exporter family protein [Clostridia bacterium]